MPLHSHSRVRGGSRGGRISKCHIFVSLLDVYLYLKIMDFIVGCCITCNIYKNNKNNTNNYIIEGNGKFAGFKFIWSDFLIFSGIIRCLWTTSGFPKLQSKSFNLLFYTYNGSLNLSITRESCLRSF